MRKLSWYVTSVAIIFMALAWVEGQQGEKKKGGFGGFGGGFGGFGQQKQNPLSLLNNQQVKTELGLTDEQLSKLTPEVMAAIARVLNEKQMKRFTQIDLQQRGNDAFKDEKVQSSLKLTAEQKKNINGILENATKELAELKGGGFGDFKGQTEKRETIRKEAKEKIASVLTSDQRKAWTEMVGDEFKLNTFGGFGGGGFGKKGAKKDAKKDDNK